MADNIHPQARQAFTEGLESVMRQWTALELAVQNQWGGLNSAEKANQLYSEILSKFLNSRGQVYKDEVTVYLEEFMEVNFATLCDDDSPAELGELLTLMWNECIQGKFTLVTNALSREYSRSEVMKQCQGIDQSGDLDDEDIDEDGEEEDEENEGEDDNVVDGTQQMSNSNEQTMEIENEDKEWQSVGKKNNRKGK